MGKSKKINGLVCSGIKKRLKQAYGAWVEELPSVLWSLQTTPNRSTGFSPFFMVHGADAVLPADVRFEAPRVVAYTEEASNEALEDAADLLDEISNIVLVIIEVYQQSLCNYHSRRVRMTSFEKGNL